MSETIEIRFHLGTIEIKKLSQKSAELLSHLKLDKRANCYRIKAMHWPKLKNELDEISCVYEKFDVFSYKLEFVHTIQFKERKHQKQALEKWHKNGAMGQIILPTGSGKTMIAVWAIQELACSTLIVVPTLDLINQWKGLLEIHLGREIGVVGGGSYDLKAITVITYASAALHMERFGDRFECLIFDECHHLPSDQHRFAAEMSMAKYRMGLSATPERADGREADLDVLIGKVVFRQEISDLEQKVLAPFEVQKIAVALNADERLEYEKYRNIYLSFLKSENIRIFGASGWTNFIYRASQSVKGREALDAYHLQKKIALNPEAKVDVLQLLLKEHQNEQILIFTHDNQMAYRLSKQFLIATITHQSGLKERKAILSAFKNGEIKALLSSYVLNEGVDVPEASVAIVMGGNSTSRDHKQRLGRILRAKAGKKAMFYELISEDTLEIKTSKRRAH